MLQELQKYNPDDILYFRKNKYSEVLPPKLQEYILQLSRAAEIHETQPNITKAAKEIQTEYPELSIHTCRQRIYDAIQLFHINNTVSEEAWCNYYADRMEELANIALGKLGNKVKELLEQTIDISEIEQVIEKITEINITEARRCTERAMTYRIQASRRNIDPDLLKPKDTVISPDITPERLGLENKNLKQLWAESREFISGIDIPETEKNKIYKEIDEVTGISDAEEVK